MKTKINTKDYTYVESMIIHGVEFTSSYERMGGISKNKL